MQEKLLHFRCEKHCGIFLPMPYFHIATRRHTSSDKNDFSVPFYTEFHFFFLASICQYKSPCSYVGIQAWWYDWILCYSPGTLPAYMLFGTVFIPSEGYKLKEYNSIDTSFSRVCCSHLGGPGEDHPLQLSPFFFSRMKRAQNAWKWEASWYYN